MTATRLCPTVDEFNTLKNAAVLNKFPGQWDAIMKIEIKDETGGRYLHLVSGTGYEYRIKLEWV